MKKISTQRDNMMEKESKIYVAGHQGLVGSAIVRQLKSNGYNNIICKTHGELDLTRQDAVEKFFKETNPDYVFLVAAKVGGIYANSTYPAEFIYKNLMIESNVIHSAYISGVKKLLFVGSGAVYPKISPQPISEDCLLTGTLEPTNEAYGIAKIAGLKMCEMYNKQYGTRYVSVMPSNLYGINDHYDPQNSHVIPGMMRRFHEAKQNNADTITVWGSGKPMREFLFSDDLADACILLMNRDCVGYYNVGFGSDVSIKELSSIMKEVIGYEGDVVFDTSMPDGTMRKLLSSSKMFSEGWKPATSLKDGLIKTYQDYVNHL